MKTIVNKEVKFKVTHMDQSVDSSGKVTDMRITKTSGSTSLLEILEPLIRTNDGQGFSDAKVMMERMNAIEAIEGKKIGEEFEVEDSVFNTLAECGKKYKPVIVDKELIELKKYLELMVSDPDKFKSAKPTKK